MLDYTVAYRRQMGAFMARVLDFPEASGFGPTVEEARGNVRSALRLAAEARLRRGELLPMPDPLAGEPDAYLVEKVRLSPGGEGGVGVTSP